MEEYLAKLGARAKEMEDPFIPNQSQLSRQTCAETFAMQATPYRA